MTALLLSTFEATSAVFAALTAFRMYHSGLRRRYPVLFGYLVFFVPYSIWPALSNTASVAYFWFWVVTQPICWLFEFLVVGEFCGLALERYRGLFTLGRWAMYGGVVVAAAISVSSMLPRIPHSITERSRLLFYIYGADRGIHLAMGIFLILMMAMASRYPVPLNRNIVVNAAIFTGLFFSTTLTSLLRTVFDQRVGDAVNLWLTGTGAASLIVWFFILTPKGEELRVSLAHFRPDDEARVLQRLDVINRFVLRLAEN